MTARNHNRNYTTLTDAIPREVRRSDEETGVAVGVRKGVSAATQVR